MDLAYVIHYVADVPETVRFYERAFGLTCEFLHEGGDYAEMATGETSLAFASLGLIADAKLEFTTPDPARPAPPVEIAFTTTDLDIAYQRAVDGGALAVSPPHEKPWGQRVSYVRDLNGFLVEICTPMRAPASDEDA